MPPLYNGVDTKIIKKRQIFFAFGKFSCVYDPTSNAIFSASNCGVTNNRCPAVADNTNESYWLGPFISGCENDPNPAGCYDGNRIIAQFDDGSSAILYLYNANHTTFTVPGYCSTAVYSNSSEPSSATLFRNPSSPPRPGDHSGGVFPAGFYPNNDNVHFLTTMRFQHLKDYCLRRDSGTMVRSLDNSGLPGGCVVPALANEERPTTLGSLACADEDDFVDPECAFFLTGKFSVPRSVRPASVDNFSDLPTTTPAPNIDFASPFPQTNNTECDRVYINNPSEYISAIPFSFSVSSGGSLKCQDKCDLYPQCHAYKYVEPTCSLYRSPTAAPYRTDDGASRDMSLYHNCTCFGCSNSNALGNSPADVLPSHWIG